MQDVSEIDLNGLNFAGLTALRERIDEKVREMHELGGPALLAEFVEKAGALGLTLEQLVQASGKRRGVHRSSAMRTNSRRSTGRGKTRPGS